MSRWIALSLAASAVGCASMPGTAALKNSWESMKPRPNRVIVSVAPNFVEKDGFPFHQGMYVRAHFFLNDEPVTMPAEGEMVFVAYDKAKNGENPVPVGVYRIPVEELAKHRQKDIVGESYVFWLPYEPETPTQMVVNASFRPTRGAPFTAEPSIVHLTPLKQAVAVAATAEKKRPRPNYVAFDSQGPKPKSAVETISLNKPAAGGVQPVGAATPANSTAAGAQAVQPILK